MLLLAFSSACETTRIVGVDPQVAKDARRGSAALKIEAEKADALARGPAPEPFRSRGEESEWQRAEALRASDLRARAQELDAYEDKILFTQGDYFFTVEPLVAIHDGLEATAIPSIGVNWRPKWSALGDTWFERSALSFQAVVGGVLNPQEQDSETAALGAGMRQPIGENGAVSFGWIVWSDGDSTEDGLYVGISVGESGTEPVDDP